MEKGNFIEKFHATLAPEMLIHPTLTQRSDYSDPERHTYTCTTDKVLFLTG